MKWIKFISSLVISYILGFTLNEGLSSTNLIREPVKNGIKILEYDIPFVYTVGLNEMLIVIFATVIISFIFYLYYSKDVISKIQVFSIGNQAIKLECIIFSFVIGTWGKEINKFINLNKYSFSVFVYSILVYVLVCIFSYEKIEKEYQNDLYESRVQILKTIDAYLQSSIETFSIVGEWGVGKTKLVKNFFYGSYYSDEGNKYRDKYEIIFIDASIYSKNEKIIEKLEIELGEILSKYKIMKSNKSFISELFMDNINFFIKIYTKFLNTDSILNEREALEHKLQTISLQNKKIVLCLDNVERLNSKKRITALFSIIDDIFPTQIKKIYLFDEKQMENIFKKSEVDFKNYISKYTLNSINLRSIYIDEVLIKNSSLNEKIKFLLDKIDFIIENIETEFDSYLNDLKQKRDVYISKIQDEVIIKLKKIKEKYKNPRYLDDLKRYLETFDKGERESIYPIMYKILSENFTNITFQEIFDDDETTLKKILELKNNFYEGTDEIKIEKICIYYIFIKNYNENKIEKEKKFDFNKNDYYLLKMNFENLFFYKKNLKTELENNLELYSKELNKNLFNALREMKVVYNEKYSEKAKEYLQKYFLEEFIISSSSEFYELINIDELEEFKELILPKVLLNSNKNFSDGSKERTAIAYIKLMANFYFLNNKYIRLGMELISSKKNFIEYKDIKLEDLDEKISELGGIDEIKLEIRKKITEHKEDLKKYLPNYSKILSSIQTYENLLEIRVEKKEEEINIKKIDYKWFLYYGRGILNLINDENPEEIKLGDMHYYCLINKKNVSEYINQLIDLRLNSMSEEVKEAVDILIIYLIKKRREFNYN